MRIYGTINRVEEQEDGTLLVSGIASSGKRDSFKTIITADAMRAAIPEYMTFANVREMHDPKKAAGVVERMEVNAEDYTEVTTRVVDPVAITKCLTGTYKGFSIGGKVTRVNEEDKSIIEGIRLTEISLVDRPSNPAAVFDIYRADDADDSAADGIFIGEEEVERAEAPVIEQQPVEEAPAVVADAAPVVERVTLASGDEVALQRGEDGRYIVVEAGDDLTRGSYTIGQLASLAESLEYFASSRSYDSSATEGSTIPAQARKLAGQLYDMLLAMVGEDVAVAKERLKEAKRAIDADVLERAQVVVASLSGEGGALEMEHIARIIDFQRSLSVDALTVLDAGDLGRFASDGESIARLEGFITDAGALAAKWNAAPAPSPIERALSKAADNGGEEEIEQEPATPLDAVKRVHQSGGIRIGGAAR